MKNKKRLGNMLGAGTLTVLLWAVFAMFGQGLAPLPAEGEFGLVAWARERVGLVEEVAASEEGYVTGKEYEGNAYDDEYEGYEEAYEDEDHDYEDHDHEEEDEDEHGEENEYEGYYEEYEEEDDD